MENEKASPTVGEWIARIDVDGWSEAVWSMAVAAARTAAAAVAATCRRLRTEPDDLADEAVLVAGRTKSYRGFPPATLLVAWFGGIIRNLLRKRRREAQRDAGVHPKHSAPNARRPKAPSLDRAELGRRVARLTRGERAALDAANDDLSQRDAARLLGISRRTYRDRLERARRCIAAEHIAREGRDRAWALRIALRRFRVGDIENAEILRLHAAGWTAASIALDLRTSLGAVKQRLHRFRMDEAVERP